MYFVSFISCVYLSRLLCDLKAARANTKSLLTLSIKVLVPSGHQWLHTAEGRGGGGVFPNQLDLFHVSIWEEKNVENALKGEARSQIKKSINK